MTLLCHKTNMLIVKYNHQTAEQLWHLDWITGAGRGACVCWRCCPGAAAGGWTDRASHPSWTLLQPATARPGPSEPGDAAASTRVEPTAMFPPIKQVSLRRFAACSWKNGFTSKGSYARTSPLNCRLDLIVGAIKHFCIFDGFFFASFSARQEEKGKQMCFKAWWPVVGCSAPA